ncbi:MAG: hypothetical protein OXG34_11940 [bacterium]|nr:hypothetical protein [bacterium]
MRLTNGEQKEAREKATCLYLNSTLGVTSAVACAAPNILSRVNFSLDTIRNLPVPVLTDEQANTLAGVFDAHAEAELSTLADAAVDPVRIVLDEAVAETLGVPPDTIAQARSELCREPSVQGR